MSLVAGEPVPDKPAVQSQENLGLRIQPDAPQPLSVENRPSSLSPQELDRIFGS